MLKKFYSKHFFVLIKLIYKNSLVDIFIKKIFLYYSFYRNFLKKRIIFIFNKFKIFFYGYKLIFILNYSLNFNRYFKFFNNEFFIFYEVIFVFNKIIMFLK